PTVGSRLAAGGGVPASCHRDVPQTVSIMIVQGSGGLLSFGGLRSWDTDHWLNLRLRLAIHGCRAGRA
ncbi:hypothetical protein, partial [Micromonospora sp. KC606]|uniref:hypothetical protein n=1 Tax=Micromonospora sp. KC606 TaxID=2530379 RepID=UPI001A9E7B7E